VISASGACFARLFGGPVHTEIGIDLAGIPYKGFLVPHEGATCVIAVVCNETITAQWHVLLTKSRQEKVLAQELDAMGIDYYLPLLASVRYQNGRKRRVDVPMFTSYLFLRGSVDDTYRADRTNRVARVIPVVDQVRLSEELTSIKLAMAQESKLEVYSYLRKGIRVEVRSGPLKGVRGVVEDRKANRLFLQVNILNAAAGLEIDGSLLEVIE
jgi:transcription antitermination factor NusG